MTDHSITGAQATAGCFATTGVFACAARRLGRVPFRHSPSPLVTTLGGLTMRLACYARSSWTASFLLWVFLAGPADAGNPPPAGFVEACYGGSFKASHAGGRAIKAYHIDADQRSWDEMRSLFRQIAQEFELSFFDTSPDMDHIKGLEIHLCSAGRFWIEARQWDWLQGAFAGEEVGPVRISAAPYGDRSGWQAVSARLEQGLYATWGKRVTVAWDDQ